MSINRSAFHSALDQVEALFAKIAALTRGPKDTVAQEASIEAAKQHVGDLVTAAVLAAQCADIELGEEHMPKQGEEPEHDGHIDPPEPVVVEVPTVTTSTGKVVVDPNPPAPPVSETETPKTDDAASGDAPTVTQ